MPKAESMLRVQLIVGFRVQIYIDFHQTMIAHNSGKLRFLPLQKKILTLKQLDIVIPASSIFARFIRPLQLT